MTELDDAFAETYAAMAVAASSFRDANPRRITVSAAGPDGAGVRTPDMPDASLLVPALQALDGLMPLVRDPGRDVWERLDLTVSSDGSHVWLSVENAMGERESVTTWGLGHRRLVAQWAVCRRDSVDAGSAWDVARRGPRRVGHDLGHGHLVDAGAHRAIDLVWALGGRTSNSCEGHPWGAYMSWRGGDPRVPRVFAGAGWRLDGFHDHVTRMPDVGDVHARDASWREVCGALERLLDGRPVPPVASLSTS